jgi:N-acetylneuraminic acid mutarotase
MLDHLRRLAIKTFSAPSSSLPTIVAFSIALFLTGCGGGGSTTPPMPTITSVTVACSPASIVTTQTSNCTATVQGTGSYSSAVTWGATDGAITPSGVFTPAATGTATMTATSTQDTEKSGTATVTVGSTTANDEWTWMGGSDTQNAKGVYGTLGGPSASNVPGARFGAVSWTDRSGNFWLFGGDGFDSTGGQGFLNDLWEFSPTNEWTWVSGSSTANPSTPGDPCFENSSGPWPRYGAAFSIDSSGNLWLFGGDVYDSELQESGPENDLWEYSPPAKTWTCFSASPSSSLYAREGAASWNDRNGNFWLFGGQAQEPSGTYPSLDDLWDFSPTSNNWTSVASTGNVPSARYGAAYWTDSSGNFWLFGGLDQPDSMTEQGSFLNDLWQFIPTNNTWTRVSGGTGVNANGVYGTQGVPASGNAPGARRWAVSWIDSSGNFWLFGGDGYDSRGTVGFLNDLWKFSTTTQEWTWVSGSSIAGASGVYGTFGVPSTSNMPGARGSSVEWIDANGNLWLFGGQSIEDFNDLWRYQP